MIKKIIVLLIILFLGIYLFGCGEETLPTTTTTSTSTTTTCVDTTTTTESTTTTTESTTTTTTTTTTSTTTTTLYPIITPANEYNMSSLLSGDILGMTSSSNYLFVSTVGHIYRIDTTTPTAVPSSLIVTNNFTSLLIGGYSLDELDCLCPINASSNPPGITFFSYDFDLSGFPPGSIPDFQYTFDAITKYGPDDVVSYSNNAFHRGDFGNPVSVNYIVSERGIVSVESNILKTAYYACNAAAIFKYNADFSIVTGKSIGTSDLVGIAFDGTYIWVIDNTTKTLYKILDNF